MTESHFRPFNDKHFVTVTQSLFERTLLKGRLIERGADRQLEKKIDRQTMITIIVSHDLEESETELE